MLRFAIAAFLSVAITGCSSIFGLEPPKLGDAATRDTAADRDAPTTPMPDSPPSDGANADALPAVCPVGYNIISGGTTTKYRFVDIPTSWAQAENDCADDQTAVSSLHTHLVVTGTNAEVAAVQNAASGADRWVGLTDIHTEGTLLWVTDEPLTYPPATGTPWDIGEPTNTNQFDCVVLNAGSFSMSTCTISNRYICECDAYAPDPAHF